MTPPDRLDGRIPQDPPAHLAPFVDAGVLTAADVHVAATLGRLVPGAGDDAVLAAALAVRAPRLGHVCVDLEGVAAGTAAGDGVAAAEVPWPAPGAMLGALRAWDAVGADGAGDHACPLRLEGPRLYLDRSWSDERAVAAALDTRARAAARIDPAALTDALERMFPAEADADQRVAAATAVLRPLAVIAGGPGTGKTTTIGRILAIIDGIEPLRPGRVALGAPTGKAAARLAEAVHESIAALDLAPATRARLAALSGTTLHRLLGGRPDSSSRFRHDRAHRLPHALVVVDEASMVSLPLMARLIEALRDDARLILVGDPEQLVSVEAGAVLGDIVGPARRHPVRRPAAQDALAAALGSVPDADPGDAPIGDCVALLRHTHRFGGGIAAVAEAIRLGDAPATLAALSSGDGVSYIDTDVTAGVPYELRRACVDAGTRLADLARAGEGAEALDALGAFRLLVAHRRGPHGVEAWNGQVERWLAGAGAIPGVWYPGRPVLVTANDPSLRLHNGDAGVVVNRGDDPAAVAFARGDALVHIAPVRLGAIAPAHAMTIHKSQGSQFGTVAVLLPPAESPLLTRELLYTAVTRARTRLIVVGEAASVRAAVGRPVARASGLEAALWGPRPA